MKAKISAVFLFVCSAASVVWLVLSLPADNRVAPLMILACSLSLLAAAFAVFFTPRVGYAVGSIAGILALQWFYRIEFWNFPSLNSWILFNLGDGDPNIFIAKLRILFVVTVVTSTACALIRLLPVNWIFRRIPIWDRTWPAFAISFMVIAAWYAASVRPYRIPLIVDAVSPELAMLHVEKNGLQFHETAITVYRDGRFFVTRNDRRLLHYRFAVRGNDGVLPIASINRVISFAESPQITRLRTAPATPLRNRTAEGWYIRTRLNVLAFTMENGMEPPKGALDLFRDLESVAPVEKNVGRLKDVCLGFCYDPVAGLGLVFVSDRCKGRNGTICK